MATSAYGYGSSYGYGSGSGYGTWPPDDDSTAAAVSSYLGANVPGDWFIGPPEVFVDRDEIIIIGRIAEPNLSPGQAQKRAESAWRRPDDHTPAKSATETAETEVLPVSGSPTPVSPAAPSADEEMNAEITDPESVVELHKKHPVRETPTLVDEIPPVVTDAERAAGEKGRISRFRQDSRNARNYISAHLDRYYGRRVSWGAVCGQTRKRFTNISVATHTRLRQPERQILDTLVEAGVARSREEALAWCVRLVGRNTNTWLSELRAAMAAVDKVRAKGPR